MKGFRVPPQPSKKEAFQKLETELANTQMANRISQAMLKQVMNNMKNMTDDLNVAIQKQYDLEYRFSAMRKMTGLSEDDVVALANQQRLVDFDEASAKTNEKENLQVAEIVGEDSTVVIKSTAADVDGKDRGIFRSRLKLSECGVPDFIKAMQGKKVGDIVETKLSGLDHQVELLSIHDPAAQPATEQTVQ